MSGHFDYTPYWHHKVSSFEEVLGIEHRRPLIVLLGDSITEGFLHDEFLAGYNIVNRGVSGDVSEAVLKRLDSSVLRLTPDLVFIMIGTNDIGCGYSDKEIFFNIETIIQKLQTICPKTRIILQSILPTRNDPTRPQDRIRKLNESFHLLAKELHIHFLDLYAHFLNNNGELGEDYSLDGLHLNGKAYGLWSRQIGALLLTLL
jgi:lysophospholipase L1-like esterase